MFKQSSCKYDTNTWVDFVNVDRYESKMLDVKISQVEW